MPIDWLDAALFAESHLSSAERSLLQRIRHPRRLRESIAVRILAKYVWISGARGSSAIRTPSAADLSSIPADEYRRLEILRDLSGTPRMYDEQSLEVARVSLSHAAGWAVAALSTEGVIGVDCERVEIRREEFLEANFLEPERAWVRSSVVFGQAEEAWLYTLLWSVKEAAWKTGHFTSRSVGDIRVQTQGSSPDATWQAAPEMIPLDWSVQGTCPRCAFTPFAGCIVSVVKFSKQVA